MATTIRFTKGMSWLWPKLRVLSFFTTVLALSVVIPAQPATAEDPPRPTQRLVSSFPVSAAPAQYELVEQVLDFPPGSSTRLHMHGGQAFVTVLEGHVTRQEGDVETVFGPGQTFIEQAGVFHTASNRGSVRARVFASFLLSPGQPQTTNHPGSPAPALLPAATYLSRTTLGTQPPEFTLTQAVVDFSPGAYQPPHRHGGPGLVMVIEGEIAFRNDAGEVRRKPGETFADVGAAHDARNVASGSSTTVVTFLIRKGEPQTTFLNTASTQPAATIGPPSTGDAGLISP